jgi:hypothetical protein
VHACNAIEPQLACTSLIAFPFAMTTTFTSSSRAIELLPFPQTSKKLAAQPCVRRGPCVSIADFL